MIDKIALEEHVSTPLNNSLWNSEGEAARNGRDYMAAVEADLLDVDNRIQRLEANGVGYSILSLTSPGIQGITNAAQATAVARETNDYVKTVYVDKYPKHLGFFAAVAMQDPERAADELERCVKSLGAHGALINGYTDVEGTEDGHYLDGEESVVFFAKAAELGVPIYLHPREPHPRDQKIYAEYTALVGSAWGFAHETATHAIRLILSGLFDKVPDTQIILGHQAEGLPLMLPRLTHRLWKQREGVGLGRNERPAEEVFRNNFYATTAGHFHTNALQNTIAELGVDRTLFSIDYPYEDIEQATEWFDQALIPEDSRVKIGRTNAERLFGLEITK
ncbi:amidohydrolase family protein [Rhodococcus tibetensis]|uniref:Amidohydrolase family protein n=1 Tax=Rhodococcus tibetensis TaxID=2965064 RepID=A0ABT1QJ75_9NOCA|nr:amidohydrolase family protein [Rhodococcus sp. FXJ9.536]MCQ4122326.1 amidohydrolase family protein [Rhodococcus sp. FXJ9.536]